MERDEFFRAAWGKRRCCRHVRCARRLVVFVGMRDGHEHLTLSPLYGWGPRRRGRGPTLLGVPRNRGPNTTLLLLWSMSMMEGMGPPLLAVEGAANREVFET
jgi:hypothetical protein